MSSSAWHTWNTCVVAVLAGALWACGDDAAAPRADAGAPRDAGMDATVAPAMDAATPMDARVALPVDAGMDAARADDAGDDDAGACPPPPDTSLDAGGYIPVATLAETGLYADPKKETLAKGVHAFEPRFALWSDGATKKRYLYLPPCTQIDTSDMDHWVFPVGTKAWKEFTRDGIRVETRLLEKAALGWYMVAYVWNAAQTKAVANASGKSDANGTLHDVPSAATCQFCHAGETDRLLGVSAIQLSHTRDGLNLTELARLGLLSDPPKQDFIVPGTSIDQTALGALHANCGHCHNPTGAGWSVAAGLYLRLLTGQLDNVTDTPAYQSAVNDALTSKTVPGATLRIVPGDADTSGLLLRLEAMRGSGGSDLMMPALATELNDDATETAVRDWIESLSP
jgi:cytochrome c553